MAIHFSKGEGIFDFKNQEEFDKYLLSLDSMKLRRFILDVKDQLPLGNHRNSFVSDLILLDVFLQRVAGDTPRYFVERNKDGSITYDPAISLDDAVFILELMQTTSNAQNFLDNTLEGLRHLHLLSIDELTALKIAIDEFWAFNPLAKIGFNEAFDEIKSHSPKFIHHRDPLWGTKSLHSKDKSIKDRWEITKKIIDHKIDDEILLRKYSKVFDGFKQAYIWRLQDLIDAGFPLSQERLDNFKLLIMKIEIGIDTQKVAPRQSTVAGFYGTELEIIMFKNPCDYSLEQLQYFIFHELTHFLCSLHFAGRHQRSNSGFSHSRVSNQATKNKFRSRAKTAKNEAFVDSLACWAMADKLPDFKNMSCADFFRPSYDPKHPSYKTHRLFCSDIFGFLPLKSMADAIFEDHKETNIPRSRATARREHHHDIARQVKGGNRTVARRWSAFNKLYKEEDLSIAVAKLIDFEQDLLPVTLDWQEYVEESERQGQLLVNGHSKNARMLPAEQTPAFLKHGRNQGSIIPINSEGIKLAREQIARIQLGRT